MLSHDLCSFTHFHNSGVHTSKWCTIFHTRIISMSLFYETSRLSFPLFRNIASCKASKLKYITFYWNFVYFRVFPNRDFTSKTNETALNRDLNFVIGVWKTTQNGVFFRLNTKRDKERLSGTITAQRTHTNKCTCSYVRQFDIFNVQILALYFI